MNRNEQAQAIQLAEHYLQNNSVDYARVILTKIIALEPTHSKASELLAYIAGDTGDHQQAFVLLQKACQSKDCSREALYHLGNLYLAQGDFENAIYFLQNATLKSGPFFEATHNMGLAFANIGNHAKAIDFFSKACELNPHSLEAFTNLGNSYKNLGQLEEALRSHQKAIDISQKHPQCWLNLGVTLHELKSYEKALHAFDQATQLDPGYGEAWSNKGVTLSALERYEDALTCQDKALTLNPQDADAWSNKSAIYLAVMSYEDALLACQKVIELRPDFSPAFYNLGICLEGLRQDTKAITAYEQAVKIKPDYQDAWINLGRVFSNMKQYEDALNAYEKVLELKPDTSFIFGALLHTKMLMCNWQNFEANLSDLKTKVNLGNQVTAPFEFITLCDDEALQLRVSQAWAKSNNSYQSISSIPTQRTQTKIRIGYFSADFHNHATSYLMAEFFELHNNSAFEIYAFSYGPNLNDAMRNRLLKTFDHFIDVSNLTDQAIAKQSQAMMIDIGIDLKGYTKDSRPRIFSYRVAPIQVSYLGYPGTMGSETIDYILADHILIPEKSQPYFSEKIIYLPNSYQTNDSKRKVSQSQFNRVDMQLPENAFIFCCFNNSYKITPQLFNVWMRILKVAPNSVLWLLNDNQWATDNLSKEAVARGVDPKRLIFANRMQSADHLRRQELADLFLDTTPCSAHTTATDALWSGLPLLTIEGNCFSGRVGASLLNGLNLPELITHTLEEYETLAIKLAENTALLKNIRHKLITNRVTSPLFDTQLLTKQIEAAYSRIYERHQTGLPPATIEI
jgi:predicted O-linked N-acetylglucosamine transferase (SPINDLY family)